MASLYASNSDGYTNAVRGFRREMEEMITAGYFKNSESGGMYAIKNQLNIKDRYLR